MRFTKQNWMKFFDGSNKEHTIRTKPSRIGHHNVYSGSYYHPEKLGEFDITSVDETTYGKLTEQNAIRDGFKTLHELQQELTKLNGPIPDGEPLFIHWIHNIKVNKRK